MSITQRNALDLDGRLESLLLLGDAHVGLGTHDTTAPLSAGILGVGHVSILDGANKLRELILVLRANLGDSKNSGSLHNR
jgi:hypothetical protein